MIFTARERVIMHLVHCPNCGGYFSEQTGQSRVSCCVMHSPGDCCHYGDRQLTSEEVAEILEVLDKANGAN